MKKLRLSIFLGIGLILSACSGDEGKTSESQQGSVDDGEAVNGYGAIDHGIDDKKVGFSLSSESIEEAQNIPTEEREQILEVFDAYISAFNEKDIDAYFVTLSKDTESFDLEEERIYMEEVFNEYDLNRVASEVTIVKYSETEAQVFAELKTSMKQLKTGLETNPTGRQVTLLTKADGDWKVASVHYIGDSENEN